MLKLKHLFENERLARKALEHWPHDPDTLDQFLSQYRISSNAIYPFSNGGITCYLRLTPQDERLERNVYGELAFIEYLIAHGYPALKPIPTRTGETVLKLATEWGDYYACAFERVAGIQIVETNCSGEIMVAYGKSLGSLHALSAQYVPTVRKWSHAEALTWIGDRLAEHSVPPFMLTALQRLTNELAALPVGADVYGLVHYDFEPDNVFYDEISGICSAIDFDDGMYHWFALDIEQALDALADEVAPEQLEKATDAFLAGYRAEHDYTPGMAATRPLMRRFCNLYCYARLITSVAEKFSDEPDWLSELRIKLDTKISQIESGFADEDPQPA